MIFLIASEKAPVAQLDRALGYGPGGSGFKSAGAPLMKKINPLYLIIISSFLVKIFAISIVGDQKIMNEWSFLIHNFNSSGVFGYNVVVNDFFATPLFATSDDIVLPTVYMPPLYFFFIYFLQVVSAEFFNLTKLVIFVQIILSTVSVFFLYKLLQKIDNSKLNNFYNVICFFPISIYASTQIPQ